MVRIAVVEKDKCNPVSCGEYLCMRMCPVNRTGGECIVQDEDTEKAKIDKDLCTGCHICVRKCPFKAIHIINLPEELTSKPIHKYGENGFHLYNLPIPMFGKVVGIVGRNGVGKSTALKILAGALKPNLGNIEAKETDFDKLIEFFKGTEAQIFFEKVKNKEIKLSYKPQHVDIIPKSPDAKGKTVKQLLEKVDEKNKLDEYTKELEIDKVLDREISQVSGGELQRVAICAAALKKSNVYFFDEPTSYLDIKQRINVSKFIRKLASEEEANELGLENPAAVLVIEHDLIILDYMTDLVHIMYGTPAAYGIVSHPKATKAGLNVFLSGYLKDENMQFRDHAIKFEEKPPEAENKMEKELTSWKDISVNLGDFKLQAKQGLIPRNCTIGVLGENGIGKTTFVKALAGVLKAKSGEVTTEVKVAYKPQYLEPSDDLVITVAKEAFGKYKNQLVGPLNLEPLMTRKLNEISGGELQRVAIAVCLSQEADLFLLDEPSAYLDVEQRLAVTKIIKDMMELKYASALIVDHDMLFIDYLSKKLVVFDGVPAESGEAKGPFAMLEGMNNFLKDLNITYRRDEESQRPRINKPGSQKDRLQKSEGKLYYT
ncbi:ribosome biogenesis/translation initiation ATPase RLI [Nanoarchaeota archaeon]